MVRIQKEFFYGCSYVYTNRDAPPVFGRSVNFKSIREKIMPTPQNYSPPRFSYLPTAQFVLSWVNILTLGIWIFMIGRMG